MTGDPNQAHGGGLDQLHEPRLDVRDERTSERRLRLERDDAATHRRDRVGPGHAADAVPVQRRARFEICGRLQKALRDALLFGFGAPRLPLLVCEAAADQPHDDERGDEIPGDPRAISGKCEACA